MPETKSGQPNTPAGPLCSEANSSKKMPPATPPARSARKRAEFRRTRSPNSSRNGERGEHGERGDSVLAGEAGGEARSRSGPKTGGERGELGVSGDFGVKEKPDERTRNGEARDESASGKARASATDEEAARAVALERRRRAARLAAAYDANLAASRASSFAGTERAFASVSGKLSLGNRGFRESRAEDEETAGVVGARAGSGARPPMRFGAADAHERRRDMSVAETATRRARAKQYGKWYVPASARDAAAYAARERRWAEKRGGALAAEVKALKARE